MICAVLITAFRRRNEAGGSPRVPRRDPSNTLEVLRFMTILRLLYVADHTLVFEPRSLLIAMSLRTLALVTLRSPLTRILA